MAATPARQRRGTALAALAALALLAASPRAGAQSLTLDAGALRTLALTAERAGALGAASDAADALIARDPADMAGRIVASRVARTRGDFPLARDHARAAWAAATTAQDRHAAALVMAQALASDGRRVEAQFWLRRAIHHAPGPAARAAAVRDFRYVRARSAFRFRLDLSVSPSSNVNNGSRHSEIPLFGGTAVLLPTARALPGGFAAASLSLRYRLAESPVQKTEFTLAGQHRAVWLDPSVGGAANAGDYTFSAIEAGIAHRRRVMEGKGELTAEVTAGHNWYGGRDLSDYLRLEGDLTMQAGAPTRALRLRGSFEKQWRLDSPRRSAEVMTVGAGIAQMLGNGDRLSVDLFARHSASADAEVSHTGAGLRLGWDRGRPVSGVGIEMGLAIEGRDYGPIAVAPSGRRDLRLEATAAFSFEKAEVMGFVPVLSLRAAHNASTSALHDGQDFGLGFGIRSRF